MNTRVEGPQLPSPVPCSTLPFATYVCIRAVTRNPPSAVRHPQSAVLQPETRTKRFKRGSSSARVQGAGYWVKLAYGGLLVWGIHAPIVAFIITTRRQIQTTMKIVAAILKMRRIWFGLPPLLVGFASSCITDSGYCVYAQRSS